MFKLHRYIFYVDLFLIVNTTQSWLVGSKDVEPQI